MARKIVVLPASDTSGTTWSVPYAFWLNAPAGNVVAVPAFVSAVPLVSVQPTYGVTAAEQSALQAGTVVEEVGSLSFETLGVSNVVQQTFLRLIALYIQSQQRINAGVRGQALVGSSWNGATWTVAP